MTNQQEEHLGYVAGEAHALLGIVISLSFQLPDRERFRKEIKKLEQYMRANIEALPIREGYVHGIENVFTQVKQALEKEI